eukprot:RCo041207
MQSEEGDGEPVVGPSGEVGEDDLSYFEAYNDLTVHRTMLQDKPRMEAYWKTFRSLQDTGCLSGRVVLDVGAGTGILSIWAAQCGAARVYGVEASGMATMAQRLVSHNGVQDKVRILQGRMEDVELPEKVDIIVSEWMGFYLLHESMLSSVLVARDRWLKPGGLLLPRRA